MPPPHYAPDPASDLPMDSGPTRSNAPVVTGGVLVTGRIIWAVGALTAGLLLLSVYHQRGGRGPEVAVPALVLLAATRPYDALLVLAALGPLATILLILSGNASGGLRFSEALTLAFLTGWMIRRSSIRPQPLAVSPWLRCSATILIAAALASGVVYGAVILAESPDLTVAAIVREYLVSGNAVNSAVFFAEGLILLLIAADVCARNARRREGVLRMMVIGAAAAAVFNVLRLVEAAMRGENPWTAFLSYLINVRVNVHHGDLNAAGSYFAMMLLIAFSFAGRAPLFAALSSVLIAAGLWIAGSRTALAAGFITTVLAGVMVLRSRGSRRKAPVVAGLTLVVVAAVGVWMWYPYGRNGAGPWSLSTRLELGQAALDMAASQPLFGVGLGQFYVLSNQYVGEMLAAQLKKRENAHNYFLQVLAELGIPGLVLFSVVILFALRDACDGVGPPGPSWGLIAGMAAFLLTCLAGHPLLVPGAAYPFWIALGLAAAQARTLPTLTRRVRLVGTAMVLIFITTVPFRTAAATRQANKEHITSGLSLWQHQPDGSRYRWAGERSSFYIDSSARSVRIPLRHGSVDPTTIEVRIFLDGREAAGILLPPGDEWRTVRLVLARHVTARFSRIEMHATGQDSVPRDALPTNDRGVLMVGKPIIE